MKYSGIRFARFKPSRFTVTILGILLGLCTISPQPVFADGQCFDQAILKTTQIPKCDATVTFPDASKPTAAVFISFTGRNPETPVESYGVIKSLETKIKLNILTTQYDLSQLQARRPYCSEAYIATADRFTIYNCRLLNILEDKEIVNVIILSQPRSERYVQDYLQFYKAGSSIKLFPAVNGYETEDFFDANRNLLPKFSIATEVSVACGIEKTLLKISIPKGSELSMGGNIESLPGGKIILGDNKSLGIFEKMTDQELYSQMKSVYPPNTEEKGIYKVISNARLSVTTHKEQISLIKSFGLPIGSLDTSMTQSGHADEVFSVIKSNARCGYSILMPSSGLALKLLASQSSPIQKEKCLNTGTANSRTGFPRDLKALSEHMNSGCLGFRGLTYKELLENPEFILLNESFEKIAEKNEILIRSYLEGSCTAPDIVKLPYLITKAPWGENEMITPNAVNALVITPVGTRNSIYINNPTFVNIFDKYIAKELNQRNIEMRLVFDDDYFGGFGGLHCGSSTIQICN